MYTERRKLSGVMKYVENRKEVLDREITGSVDRRSETESMEHEEHMQYRDAWIIWSRMFGKPCICFGN